MPVLYGQELSIFPEEDLFISTDRDVYFPGEDIYIKTWQKSKHEFTPSGLAYIELLTYDNDIVTRKILKLKQYGGAAIIEIPEKLSSGYYVLRAYTSWLKNYGPDYFAYRKIMILNPLIDNSFNFPEPKSYTGKTVRANFFIEGERIARGLNNRVYVKFENLPGNSLEGAFISNERMDTLALLNVLDENTAYFDFTPYSGKYEIRIPAVYPHKELALPETESAHAKLFYTENFNGLRFMVQKTDTTIVFDSLSIRMQNINDRDELIKVVDNVSNDAFIYLKEIPPGMNRFELINHEGIVLSEVFYLKNEPGHMRLKLRNNTGNYTRGDTVRIDLEVFTMEDNPSSAMMNVFIKKKNPEIIKQHSFKDFMAYGKYLHLEPGWDFDLLQYRRAVASIYGSAVFEMENIPKDKAYLQENRQYSIKGKYSNGDSKGKDLFLSFPGDSSQIFIFKTTPEGYFSIHLPHIHQSRESVLKTADSIKEGFLMIEDVFYPEFVKINAFPESFDSLTISHLNDLFLEWQINNYYSDSHKNLNHKKEAMFYDDADFYISMDNYIDFPNMSEVFFEIIKPAMIFDQNKDPRLKIIDRGTNRTLGNNPLYVIDGVPFTNPGYAMELPPDRVRDIAIIARRYFIGPEEFDG
ncbi:MAG: hypothetical protein ACOCWA_08040, partial [Bacteroidota bacterium]